jgi:Domain of unknown function (DUF4328)/Protein of unknown function (DUF2510)
VNSGPVAEWYHDPMHRARHRYWDGQAWSQWVATEGVARFDPEPLAPGLPPPPPLAPPSYPPPVMAGAWPRVEFRSLKGLTVALTWVVGVEVLVLGILGGTIVNRIVKLNAFDSARTFANLDAYNSADSAVSSAAGWAVVVAIAVFVLYVIYLFRASKNTAAWNDRAPAWSPGWTIGAWFIPVANLVLPFLVVRELWRRSRAPGGVITVWWWILLVAGGATASIDISPSTYSDLRDQNYINLAGAVMLAVAAVLLIGVVRALTRAQEASTASPAPR